MTVIGATITWEGLSLRAGRTFTTRIKADISNTVRVDVNGNIVLNDNKSLMMTMEEDGIYPFATTINTPGIAGTPELETDPENYNDARLYAVKGDNEKSYV